MPAHQVQPLPPHSIKTKYNTSDGNVFQVQGLSLISASAAWGRVAVALEKTLFVLGESCSSLLLQLVLEETVSLVLWVPQGEFLVVGDVVGKLHFLHVASCRLLFSR